MSKVLIIDDELAILQLFKYVFEDAGHSVSVANNGRQALSAVLADLPEFMVVDVAMPEMSGKEFVLELKRRALSDKRLNSLRFVVMTGENFMDLSLNSAFASHPGFVCFFPKMTPPELVLQKAEEVLKK